MLSSKDRLRRSNSGFRGAVIAFSWKFEAVLARLVSIRRRASRVPSFPAPTNHPSRPCHTRPANRTASHREDRDKSLEAAPLSPAAAGIREAEFTHAPAIRHDDPQCGIRHQFLLHSGEDIVRKPAGGPVREFRGFDEVGFHAGRFILHGRIVRERACEKSCSSGMWSSTIAGFFPSRSICNPPAVGRPNAREGFRLLSFSARHYGGTSSTTTKSLNHACLDSSAAVTESRKRSFSCAASGDTPTSRSSRETRHSPACRSIRTS